MKSQARNVNRSGIAPMASQGESSTFVTHGDLLRLGPVRGDVVVIIDGYYHQRASVRHKEILALLADGVAVLGCSSMGALRAAELATYGMVGNGAVYRMYVDGVLDADDEVALAHTSAPDHRGLTCTLPLSKYRTAAPTTMTASRVITRTGNHAGNFP